MILVILASGSGTRLKNKTKKIPKCLVKINEKPILQYMENFIRCFERVFIVAGYRANKIEKFLKNKNIKLIKNRNFKKTNMVHSMFCASKNINEDVVVAYSDIVFDYSIYNLLKRKKLTTMPIKIDWLKIWKKRMPFKEIKNDAENLIVKNNTLISIGTKINNTLPKFQFMGLLKIVYKDFLIMKKYYKKINNRKIDFTSFINLLIKEKKIKVTCLKTKKFWIEIDTIKDLVVANKFIKKNKL